MKHHQVMSDDEWSALQRLESHLEAKRARGGSQWQEIEVLALGAWKYSDTKETIDLPTTQQISCAVCSLVVHSCERLRY